MGVIASLFLSLARFRVINPDCIGVNILLSEESFCLVGGHTFCPARQTEMLLLGEKGFQVLCMHERDRQ